MATRDDLIIVGGGPIGVWGLYHASLGSLRTRLIESLDEPGGQLTAMYPEKDIYDVPGFPKVKAGALVDRLVAQSVREGSSVCLGEEVLDLAPDGDGWCLTTSAGLRSARSVIITTGLGAFHPKRLEAVGEDRFLGRGLSHFVKHLADLAGQGVVVIGGGDSALDWALSLRGIARSVTLVHRRDRFAAHDEAVRAVLHDPGVRVLTPYRAVALEGDDRLSGVLLAHTETGEALHLEADHVVAAIGVHADAGPLRRWGLDLDRDRIRVAPDMRTNLAGVFAAGDVVTYPGRVNLIAVGFGEMAIAVHGAAEIIHRACYGRSFAQAKRGGF